MTPGPPAGHSAQQARATTSARRTAALELHDLHKSHGSVHAVAGLDLVVEPGEIVAFLGPDGAGKTTTIDMVLGWPVPTPARRRCSG